MQRRAAHEDYIKISKKKKNDKLLKNKKITAKNNWKQNFWKISRLPLIQRMRHSRRMYDTITLGWGAADNTASENFRKWLGQSDQFLKQN